MKWYEKFKVGQEVKVVKKVARWSYGGGSTSWAYNMDFTMGKVYKIIEVDNRAGYRLHTQLKSNTFPGDNYLYDFYYPVESLACVGEEQLVFDFME